MKKTRVLFHVTHLRRGGGIESSLMSWLRVLDREKYSVGLSIAYPTEDLDAIYRERIPEDVTVHMLGAERWLSRCRNLKITGKLSWPGLVYEELLLPQFRKRVFRKRMDKIVTDYDIVIDYDLSLARFASDFHKPLIGISHFSFEQRLSGNRSKYRKALHYYQRYDSIVTICEAMEEEGKRLFPDLANRFVTIYPGFDLMEINSAANEAVSDLPPAPYIVSVTRLEETQKDVITLINAYAMLVKQYRITEPLLIVGQGRHLERLEAFAKQVGMQDRIIFAGFKAKPLPYVKGAHLMVLSSKHEGLPTALIEGLILGQVMVSTDCPTGPKEVLKNGEAGLLVPVGDAPALAQAMRRALKEDDLRRTLQVAANIHAHQFGVSAFRERFQKLMQQYSDKLGIEKAKRA